jgi:hypothetical protein
MLLLVASSRRCRHWLLLTVDTVARDEQCACPAHCTALDGRTFTHSLLIPLLPLSHSHPSPLSPYSPTPHTPHPTTHTPPPTPQDREAGIFYQAFEADFQAFLSRAFDIDVTDVDGTQAEIQSVSEGSREGGGRDVRVGGGGGWGQWMEGRCTRVLPVYRKNQKNLHPPTPPTPPIRTIHG